MLQLLISTPRRSYAAGEEIELTVTLANQGGEALLVNARMALNTPFAPEAFREVTVHIARQGEEELPFDARINIGAPREKDFRLLAPGERIERQYQLRRYFDLQDGTYTAQAVYRSRQPFTQGNAHAWQGEIVSDAITFTVGPA